MMFDFVEVKTYLLRVLVGMKQLSSGRGWVLGLSVLSVVVPSSGTDLLGRPDGGCKNKRTLFRTGALGKTKRM